jgi:DNA-binding MarR family transcriptional regulator
MAKSCYCTALRKAARRMTSLYDDALAPVGVNIAQFSLLRNVARSETVSLTDLGQQIELDRSTVGRNVKVLVKAGLLNLSKGKDQREAMLALTDNGRKVLADGAPLWEAVQGKVERALGSNGSKQFQDLLQAIPRRAQGPRD